MTPNMLRRLWSLVESSQPERILELDDGSLVEWLMNQMDIRNLSTEQSQQDFSVTEAYIRNHLLLIRDIADHSWQDTHPLCPVLPN